MKHRQTPPGQGGSIKCLFILSILERQASANIYFVLFRHYVLFEYNSFLQLQTLNETGFTLTTSKR